MRQGLWIVVAGILGLSAVALGAVAAHGGPPDPQGRLLLEMGLRYQLWHAAVLLALAFALGEGAVGPRRLKAARIEAILGQSAAASFALGVILFSGSLYLKVFAGAVAPGWLTPMGGGLLMLGWGMVIFWGGSRMVAIWCRRRHGDVS